MNPEQGLFIPAAELPEQVWKVFFHICSANGLTPREMVCKMIIGECKELEALRNPLLDQILSKIGQLVEKKLNGPKH